MTFRLRIRQGYDFKHARQFGIVAQQRLIAAFSVLFYYQSHRPLPIKSGGAAISLDGFPMTEAMSRAMAC
jgi:hypothetical protein